MTHRRTLLTACALVGTALLHTVPMQAQQTTPPPAGERRGPAGPVGQARRGPPTLDERVARMTTELSLSAEQAGKVRASMLAEQRGMDSVLARRTAARDAERAAMMATRTTSQKALASILTPEQKLKHDAMRARRDGGRHRMGRGGPGRDVRRGRPGMRGAERGGRAMRQEQRDGRRVPPPDDAQAR